LGIERFQVSGFRCQELQKTNELRGSEIFR
jgi:hypothetical protein